MSGYISPNSSGNEGPPVEGLPVGGIPVGGIPVTAAEPNNARPQLNEALIGVTQAHLSRFPPGIFTSYHRNPAKSRDIGSEPPFFKNAKPASMLENGWIRSFEDILQLKQLGLLAMNDGPQILVKVIKNPPDINGKNNYTFWTGIDPNPLEGHVIFIPMNSRYYAWDFYTPTTPVPFVARFSPLAAALPGVGGGGGGGGGGGVGGGGGGGSWGGGLGSSSGSSSSGLGSSSGSSSSGLGSLGGRRKKIKKTEKKNKRSKKSRRKSN